MNQLSDKEIIEKILNGNHELFGLIIKRYENCIAATIKGMIGDCPEAEEVGQDTFIRFYQSLGRFRGESSLKTYLVRIAMNLSLNEIKRKKRMLNRTSSLGTLNQVPEKIADRMDERNDIKDLIHHALQRLEPKHRSVLVLRVIEGYSTQETAKILKVPVGTVLSRLSRAQENVRKILGTNWYL